MEITKNYYTIDEEMEIDRYMEICDIKEWEAEHILKHIENVLEYIEESKLSETDMQELMKLSDKDILKIMQSDERKARPIVKLMALMKAFDQYYGDQFDHELVEERYNQGKFIYDDDLGYWIEP